MTKVERLQNFGIQRLGNPQRGFRYESADGSKISNADLIRINELKIPPAWTEVGINPSPKGRLQAVGKDMAGRWQYLYHEDHVRIQERRKFARLIRFAESLPKMRATTRSHLRQRNLGRERVMASIVRILATCFMRPGSQVYASENGSYGIATLRPRHVAVKGDLVSFDFPGKSSVRQRREIRDRQVARVVRSLLQVRGREVFKYQNGDGIFVDVKRRHINEYIKETMGENFSAKDFRTWAGTLICACALARAGAEGLEKASGRRRAVVAAIKETAGVLGNTPAVCRSSYICPDVIRSFESGRIIDRYFSTLEDFIAYRGNRLHPAERALLKLLKRKAK